MCDIVGLFRFNRFIFTFADTREFADLKDDLTKQS